MTSRIGSLLCSLCLAGGVLSAGCEGTFGAVSSASGRGDTGSGSGGSSAVGSGHGGATTGSGTGAGSGMTTPPPVDPGFVTIRRLNRVEYDNTVRDLLGTTKTPGATTFPDDAPQVGFDNDGSLQTLSPVQFSLYQQAAESLAAEAMTTGAAARAKLVTCDLTADKNCGQTLISNFGLRAFRRPLATSEVSSYVGLMSAAAQAGATPDEQFRTVIEAMLVSPNFLFRPEVDSDPTSMTPHTLGPYEIASRLSYMVYRSMPDQALFDAAANGLSKPADIQAQLQRMLADPRSVFGPTFAGQWLGIDSVSSQTFDAKLFPKFSPALASSMSLEVTQFFQEFLSKNEPVTQLLTANFTYLDSNLASLYGVPAPAGTGLVRTTLNTPQRGGGLLTMAAVLSSTSYPTRTSVVKRGNWVLGQLLCAPAPPPPPDVPAFPTDVITATTQKDILLQHRSNASCAFCHESLDNIGIAMENYDAIGAYRTMDGTTAVDSSGQFAGQIANPGGNYNATFTGGTALAAAVAADPRFQPCFAQNVMSYALGRSLTDADAPYLAQVTAGGAGSQLGVRDILMNVVANDTFRMRRGESAQ